MAEEFQLSGAEQNVGEPGNISDEILGLIQKNTKNPSEGFVLLQQLTIYVWDQFKIDWKNSKGRKLADTRKQRYLDYVGELIDGLKAANMLTQVDQEKKPESK